ncbi:hypothetical protein [Streptomyces sp. NPDC004682]
MGGLRNMSAPFVAPGPSGVAVRDRLKHLSAEDERVLRLVGDHLGSLASRDPKVRCVARDDQDHARSGPGAPGREGPRPRVPGPRTRSVRAGRGAKAGDQRAQHRSGHMAEDETWQQDPLPLSLLRGGTGTWSSRDEGRDGSWTG